MANKHWYNNYYILCILCAMLQGKGEFSMEYCRYQQALPQLQNELVKNYEEGLKKAKK